MTRRLNKLGKGLLGGGIIGVPSWKPKPFYTTAAAAVLDRFSMAWKNPRAMVSFLHAADLHLGLRITRFDPGTAEKIREARFAALDKVLATVREKQVDFLVIAGDVFDDSAVDATTARRAFKMLESS